jgi:hypothetical protein
VRFVHIRTRVERKRLGASHERRRSQHGRFLNQGWPAVEQALKGAAQFLNAPCLRVGRQAWPSPWARHGGDLDGRIFEHHFACFPLHLLPRPLP